MSVLGNIITKFRDYQEESGFVAAFFNFFQGRSTAFAIVFTVCGLILAFRGKLTMVYPALVTAIQGLVFAHSCKEDWHMQKMAQIQQNATNTTITTDSTTKSASSTPALVVLDAPVGPPIPMEGR
jgi:hypothetical protein